MVLAYAQHTRTRVGVNTNLNGNVLKATNAYNLLTEWPLGNEQIVAFFHPGFRPCGNAPGGRRHANEVANTASRPIGIQEQAIIAHLWLSLWIDIDLLAIPIDRAHHVAYHPESIGFRRMRKVRR